MKQEMFEMLFALLNTPRLEWKVIFMTGSIFCAAPLLISHFISASETHCLFILFIGLDNKLIKHDQYKQMMHLI